MAVAALVAVWFLIWISPYFLQPLTRPELGNVKQPVFEPVSWPEDKKDEDEIMVKITVSTPKACIYWSVNEPVTEKSPVYEGYKISVRRGDTLRAFAKRDGMSDSPVVKVTFK